MLPEEIVQTTFTGAEEKPTPGMTCQKSQVMKITAIMKLKTLQSRKP